jgi:transcriptional repressor NrdR
MRCPWCSSEDDRVVDSRSAQGGAAIRRRRECTSCGRRFTTFERVDELGVVVCKRDGSREPYDREKVLTGLRKALANSPVTEGQVAGLADRVGERLRERGAEVSSQDVGLEVLAGLKAVDEVAYLRFASVYKDFQQVADFEREVSALTAKREPATDRDH